MWGRRDVTQAPDHIWQRVNPSVGIALNDVTNNAPIGVTIDLGPRIYLSAGLHCGRTTTLDPNADVRVGSVFQNRASAIPTLQEWHFGGYYGATINLEAAVSLLRTAIGSATGGKS